VLIGASVVLAAAIATSFWIFSLQRQSRLGMSPVSPKSVAVLPFENFSADKENAFFADGIQDDILTSLARIRDLKVISRSSVMQFRDVATRNLREIGKTLGVANILEGSVRREGNRVVVGVQLIDALHDRHIWANRYDRTLADSLGLQGELASEIADALRATLTPDEKARMEKKPTENTEAYQLYLKGRYFWNKRTEGGAEKRDRVFSAGNRERSELRTSLCRTCRLRQFTSLLYRDASEGSFSESEGRSDKSP
jgi:TolB-like protein